MPLLTRVRGNKVDQPRGPAGNASGPVSLASVANPLKRRHRGRLLMTSVFLVVAGALAAAWLVSTANARQAVLAVAQPVSYGERVERADLTTAHLGTDPAVAAVPAEQLNEVIGQYATSDLPVGALLTDGQFAASPGTAPNQQVVGVAVGRAQLPERTLRAHDRVLVAAAPAVDADPPLEDPQVIEATVVDVGSADESGVRVVEVSVPTTDGPRLAAWSATGRVAIVIEPRR